jgi:PhnB protein
VSEPHAEIQPELWTDDAPGAVAFYERAFGAVVEHRVDGPTADELVAQLSVGGARFWVSNASDQLHRFSPEAIGGTTARMLLVVEDPESLMQSALNAGATETSPVRDEHGWQIGRCVDPFGHEWEIGRPGSGWPATSS